MTGIGASDGNGLSALYRALVEPDIQAPATVTIRNTIGLQAEASFFGSMAAATVTNLTSMKVKSSTRKDGATAGTVTNVYGL